MKKDEKLEKKLLEAQKLGLFGNSAIIKPDYLDEFGNYCFLYDPNKRTETTLNDISNNIVYFQRKAK